MFTEENSHIEIVAFEVHRTKYEDTARKIVYEFDFEGINERNEDSNSIVRESFYKWTDANILRGDLNPEHISSYALKFFIVNDVEASNSLAESQPVDLFCRVFLRYISGGRVGGYFDSTFITSKKNADRIEAFFKERSCSIRQDAKFLIENCVLDEICSVARNCLCLINENYLLNPIIVTDLYRRYSIRYHSADDLILAGRAHAYEKAIKSVCEVIDSFVEIAGENVSSKERAEAIVWESIEHEAITYFADMWNSEYGEYISYNYDFSPSVDSYIEAVLICDEIDLTNIRNVALLTYYIRRHFMFDDTFATVYKLVNKKIPEITKELRKNEIKRKLLTPQKRKIATYSISDIDIMDGHEFEEFVASLFSKMGYSVQITKASGDQGIDVIATRNDTTIGIQCKCYGDKVGNTAVQEVVAGKNYYNCNKVMVISNNYFTPSAVKLAAANNVILWNRDILKEKIKDYFSK